jgi:hypothetical protein
VNAHYHTGLAHILTTAIGVIIVINVARVVAGKMAKSSGVVGTIGVGIGALVK